MSFEIEDQCGMNRHTDSCQEPDKKVKFSYTRDFLLSLSDLEICRKLPVGFDESVLSEFEDTSQDRYRIPGSLSSQTLRHNERGSSAPSKGDVTNCSRSIHGRRDSSSSGKSNRDSDSQYDPDSDSGRRYGNQTRRPWQVSEHDGLLGSGSFPRPSENSSAALTSKFRSNDQFHLNRSKEPYHPPRPYKAVPHSRRDTDSYNEETFGSSECTSEDRTEEERKRRASFESMRKEQQKAFQEQKKLHPEKRKAEFDITLLREDTKDDKPFLNRTGGSEQVLKSEEFGKASFTSADPVSRPLVPPGFSSTVVEKSTETKSSINPLRSESVKDLDRSFKENHVINETFSNCDEKQSLDGMGFSDPLLGNSSISLSATNKNENVLDYSSGSDFLSKRVADNSQVFNSEVLEAHKASENHKVMEIDAENVMGNEVIGENSSAHSASILDKLFGNASTRNRHGPCFAEQQDVKPDDSRSHSAAQSSKFTRWFLEEGGEKGGSQDLDVKNHISLDFLAIQSPELVDSHVTTNTRSANLETTKQLCTINKPKAVSAVLTCEDLEQSILSEVTESSLALLPPEQGWMVPDANIQKQKAGIDDQASRRLLLLLQKDTDTGPNDTEPSANLGWGSSKKLQNTEVATLGTALNNSKELDSEKISDSGKPLTLETLFGTAFMKELKSGGASASGQRDSVGYPKLDPLESHGLHFPLMDNSLLAPAEISLRSGHRSGVLASNGRHRIKSDRIDKQFLGFDPSHLQSDLGSKFAVFDQSAEVQLPKEDRLIPVGDPPSHQNFMPIRNPANTKLLPIQETPVNIVEKLAALNSMFRDERPIVGYQDGQPFIRGTYDTREPNVHQTNPHTRSSSLHHHPTQMIHGGQVFHPLDSHPANMKGQMKFMVPENRIYDAPNYQFPPNIFHPPFQQSNTTVNGFDSPTQNPLLQEMRLPGNFTSDPQRELPRGATPSSHPEIVVAGFIQKPHQMQGFPASERQPDFGGLAVPRQAPDVGGRPNHPEALQRLTQMDARPNSKQIHSLASATHGPGMYGHELGMGTGYR